MYICMYVFAGTLDTSYHDSDDNADEYDVPPPAVEYNVSPSTTKVVSPTPTPRNVTEHQRKVSEPLTTTP